MNITHDNLSIPSPPAPRVIVRTTPNGMPVASSEPLDAAVSLARSFAELVAILERADPQFAAKVANLTVNQSLLGAKTFWMPPLVSVISWLATHYLGAGVLDPTACAIIAFGIGSSCIVVCRWVTRYQVNSVLPAGWTGAPPAALPELPSGAPSIFEPNDKDTVSSAQPHS